MAAGYTLNEVFVTEGHGAGAEPAQTPDKTIQYAGEKIEARFNQRNGNREQPLNFQLISVP
jgi:hypothetical protein